MSLKARKELLASIAPRYRAAPKADKQRILDEFTAATGYHRKYALTLLNTVSATAVKEDQPLSRRPRKTLYHSEVQAALVMLWEAAGRICSKRLVPFLPQLVEVMERHGYLSLTEVTRERLLMISPATVDRLLAQTRRASKGRGRTTTLPGSLLKHHVPLRTFSDWDDLRVGFIEADLVAHCGTSTEGSYLYTLTMTDVSTAWTECLALLYRDQDTVLRGLRLGRERLPFPLLGLDTDNGSEFLNYLLLGYCEREEITFTRSRAYKKNDQCHVEQKNGSIVRRFIGYDRFEGIEGIEACRALAELYETMRLYVNFFQPSMKLTSKERRGSKVVKKYDKAQTPYQRVLASGEVSEAAKQALREQFHRLDPVALLARLEGLQDRFWHHAYVPARELNGSEQPSTAATSPLVVAARPTRDVVALSGVAATASVVAMSPSLGGDGASVPAAASVSPAAKEPADRAGRMYRKTKRKGRYHLVKHTWRTRPDPFAEVWPEVEEQLRKRPHLAAKTLFVRLQERYPGRFKDGQLRTMQRRVKAWRLQQASFVAKEIGLVLSREVGVDDVRGVAPSPVRNERVQVSGQVGLVSCVHTTCQSQHLVFTYASTTSTVRATG